MYALAKARRIDRYRDEKGSKRRKARRMFKGKER
jgi:hypothetical protein